MSDAGLDLTEAELREGLTSCLAVPRWVDDVSAKVPYASLDDLLRVAADAATPLSQAEVDQALADHPRLGDRPVLTGRAAAFSRAEEASSQSDDAELAASLAAGQAAYEQRFGRLFLVRSAGRSGTEFLAELQRRLENDPADELAETGRELRDIALRRIPQLFTHLDHHSGYDDSDAAR